MVMRQEISIFAFWRDIMMVACAVLTLSGGVYLWWADHVSGSAQQIQENKDRLTAHDIAISSLSAAVAAQVGEDAKIKEDVSGIKSTLNGHDGLLKDLKEGQKDGQQRLDLLLEHFAI